MIELIGLDNSLILLAAIVGGLAGWVNYLNSKMKRIQNELQIIKKHIK